MSPQVNHSCEGFLLVDKPKGFTAFDLVAILRKRLNVRTIGHAGTLDPMATGVMVMLVGKKFTTLSNQFLNEDKEYIARIYLGAETDTYDAEGTTLSTSDKIPSREEVIKCIESFQGEISQIPPMYSAKKINGQKLYHLARQGKTVEREPRIVKVHTELLAYEYPYVDLRIECSKGTYIRSIAHDLGQMLGCGAHLTVLSRTRSGSFRLSQCINGDLLSSGEMAYPEIVSHLRKSL